MKKIVTICIIPVSLFFVSVVWSFDPVLWQYDDDKFVSSKKKNELAWDYDNGKIDYFEIDREIVKIEEDDISEIFKLVKDKNDKKLIDIERKYRDKITYNKVVIKYVMEEKRGFIDKEMPLPTFGVICFYQVFAVVHPDRKKPNVIKSPPAELSVIILPQTK